MNKFSCKLSVDAPCPTKWADMQSVVGGNYCSICAIVVIDFTELSDDEILSIVAENKAQQICGKFKSSQLNRALEIQDTAAQNGFSARARGLLASLFLMAIPTMTSANNMQEVAIRDTSITPVENIDTIPHQRIIKEDDGIIIGAVRLLDYIPEDKPYNKKAERKKARRKKRFKRFVKNYERKN